MEVRLVEFARLLRTSGVRVSAAEVADAAQAAALVGLDERATFRAAIRSALVKRASDIPAFERLFELYFSGFGQVIDGVERGLVEALRRAGLLESDLDAVASALERLLPGMAPLSRAALTGDRAGLARLLRASALSLDFAALTTVGQVGFYGRRLLAGAGGSALGEDVAALSGELARNGVVPAALERVSEHLEEIERRLEEASRRYAEIEQRARAGRRAWGSFGERPFAALTREEIVRTELAVRRLAERLKTRLRERERSRGRGTLNVRRTLRRNLALGGLPARLAFRRRRPERPDVVVLCDVSDSVRHVSRMMLLLLYTLQARFTRVRSFVFVSDLGEVTQAFRAERDVARAVDLATAGKVVSLHGNSNYGRALRLFHRAHLGALTRRTTVLVIGDGRTNYNDPHAWVLRDMRRKARRVLWICPEERWAWGTGDSEMPLYGRHVDRVAVVTCLADLEEVAEALVPRVRQ